MDARIIAASVEHLRAVNERLEATARRLANMNSSFPATREFLAAKGIENVDELDETGTKELYDHLLDTLSAVKREKGSPS